MTETVLVTGGSGYLGGWCIVEMLRQGYEVRASVRDLGRESEVRESLATEVEAGARLSFVRADLGDEAGWSEAVADCRYVLHVASPFPSVQPDDPDELIIPAREGTLRVVGAALDAGAERVVVTSSVAAIRNDPDASGSDRTEANWTDSANEALSPYTRSKTIAERAAWDFVEQRGQRDRLAVVNPGAILGPVLSDDRSYSLQVVERLMGGLPGVPKFGFGFVDVRDVAALEIAAMTSPEAGGERFIAVNSFLWMSEVGEILRNGLGSRGAKVTTRTVPNLAVRAMAIFDPSLRSILGDLGQRVDYSNEHARSLLGWQPRPLEETIIDCAESLIQAGVVKQ